MLRKAVAPGPAAALFALAAVSFMGVDWRDFCLDDAWIHLAYAKSLRLGDGLSYNPGDHETGFSSPLWLLLIAALPWPESPVVPVKLLGVICHAALAWGVARTIELLARDRRDVSPRVLATIGGAICAFDPALAFAATSGMEVSLTAALTIWTVVATLAGRPLVGAGLAAAAVWARPESLMFIGAWAGLRALALQSRAALLPLVAAGAAFLIWTAYCWLVSGYPFPNTYYAKRDAQLGFGVLYFILQYLPEHAWVFGVSGLVLLGFAAARGGEARRLFLAWLAASIAIAGTRVIQPHVLFYYWRYFAVLGGIPIAALTTALPARRGLAAAALVPVALAIIWRLPVAGELQRGQDDDIHLVHTAPAQFLARTLPRGARILVEGAGATRFFLPRDAWVIDAIGLNSKTVVHAADGSDKVCAALRLGPTFVSLPAPFYANFEEILTLEKLREFVAPQYRIVLPPRPERVIVARITKLSERVRAGCRLP